MLLCTSTRLPPASVIKSYCRLSFRSVPFRCNTGQARQSSVLKCLAPNHTAHRARRIRTFSAATDLSNGPQMNVNALSQAAVVVATKPGCPYCKKAKAALGEAGVAFQEFDASRDADLRALVRDISNSSTVPQVFVGGRSLGGSDDLQAALASGAFQTALAAAQASKLPALPSQLTEAISRVSDQHAESSAPGNQPGQESQATVAALTEVAGLLAHPTTGVKRTDATIGGKQVSSFTGQDLITWLTKATPAPGASPATTSWLTQAGSSPSTASAAASQLLTHHLISPVSSSPPYPIGSLTSPPSVAPASQYLITSQAGPPARGQPLNTAFWWSTPARPPIQVAEGLRDLILQLYDRHLSADGRAVSYAGIKADPLFQDYVRATAELQQVDISGLRRDELCALFINLYNALIIHALCVLGAPANAAQRVAFFTKEASYCIGGQTYTADDMENGVLRGNRAAASNIFVLLRLPQLAGGQFKRDDPRAAKVVTPMDPRIHFALVCGAKSCPPISVYTPDNLDEGLAAAGEAFCASEVEVDLAGGVVKLSKILQWYSVDFGKDDREKLQFVLQFLKGSARSDLEALLASGRHIKVQYKPYDWNLNE